MAAEPIILIDLPTRPPVRCWSLNPWKTRFVLNFKALDYKTEWTEYPDLKARLKDCVPSNPAPLAEYTSPTIRLPDGTWVTNSRKIAAVLEERYPEPSLDLDSPQLARLEELMPDIMPRIRGVYMPIVPEVLLNEHSRKYWYRTRPAAVGMPLDQLAREKGGARAWADAAPILKEVTALLNEVDGPFFAGDQVSYADFVWGGFLVFLGCVGEEHLEAMLETSGDRDAHLKLLAGVKPWAERDGY